jgi:GntR family transcriptional regulator/MocR family aminotransferase
VAEGLAASTTPASSPNTHPRRVSAFAECLLAFPAPVPTQAPRVADFRYGDLSASDFPTLAWRRALNARRAFAEAKRLTDRHTPCRSRMRLPIF